MYRILPALIILFLTSNLFSQDNWKVRGRFQLNSDHYSFTSNSDALNGRRPASLTRVLIAPTFSKGSDFSMPVYLLLPLNRTNEYYAGQNTSLESYFLNPANVVRISPRYKWASLDVGRIFPQLSELTIGNVGLFGAHLRLRPGKFVLEVVRGVQQQAIAPDTASGFFGIYKKTVTGLKVGIGAEDKSFFHINASYAKDDPASLVRFQQSPTPEESFTVAPSFGMLFFQKLQWKNEVAIGIFTRNTQSAYSIEDYVKVPTGVFSLNATSNIDFAFSSSLSYRGKNADVALKSLYLGPGFKTPGYPFLQNDRLEFSLSPSFRMLKNRLYWNSTFGYRINNLAETKTQKTTQVIGSTNINFQPNSQWNFNFMFANFGIRNDISSDSLKIQNISNTLNFSPSYFFNSKAWQYQLMANVNVNDFEEFNTQSGEFRTQLNSGASLNMISIHKKLPLDYSVGGNYFKNNDPAFGLELLGAQLGLGYKWLDRKLRTYASSTINFNSRAGETNDSRVGLKLGIDYKLKKYRFTLKASRNHYEYGSLRPDVQFTEWFYQTSLVRTF